MQPKKTATLAWLCAPILVSIHSPGLLAEKSMRASSDLGIAIIESLYGMQFGEPFVSGYAVKFKSIIGL